MKIVTLSNSGNPEFKGQHQSNLEAVFSGRTMACFLVLSLVMSKVHDEPGIFCMTGPLGISFGWWFLCDLSGFIFLLICFMEIWREQDIPILQHVDHPPWEHSALSGQKENDQVESEKKQDSWFIWIWMIVWDRYATVSSEFEDGYSTHNCYFVCVCVCVCGGTLFPNPHPCSVSKQQHYWWNPDLVVSFSMKDSSRDRETWPRSVPNLRCFVGYVLDYLRSGLWILSNFRLW